MKRAQAIARSLLLAFVWITLGFAVGKEVTLRSGRASAPHSAAVEPAGAQPDRVEVYYLHATFRCVTCNTIEQMTRSLLESKFGTELADGRIQWREADFQQEEALAKRFEVVSSCVVVAGFRNGKETSYRRLDEVWTLLNDPPAFEKYVSDAIHKILPAASPEEARS
jgi:hypothetical protein